MAMVGDAESAPASSTYGGGGVGGKFERRSFRRNRATPYDRPPTSLRNPGLLSKLVVDPAKKLIASSASRLFSSVFRKRLLPPPPSESNPELSDQIQAPVLHDEGQQTAGADCQNSRSDDKSGMLELEQLLKEKAFTKSEIDRLTNLLRSKAVDLPAEENVKIPETSLLKPVTDIEKHRQFQECPFAEKGLEIERSQGLMSTPGISSRVLDEDMASPAELAKAYMDRLPSKVSPAMLSLRSRATGKTGALLSNTPFTPTSSVLPLATRTAGHLELGKNGFTTPSSRGRSAIYSMASNPYSRVYPTTSGKAGGSSGYLLHSSTLLDQDGKGSKKLGQKRRSSVLDDVGSVGPMRRIRQKHGLISHKVSISSGGIDASGEVKNPLSLLHKHSFMDDWNDGDKAANTKSTSYYHVPPKSSEMAAKILQHLENIAPKEKSAYSKPDASGERYPSKLTTEMLNRPALNNFESAGSSNMLQSIQDHQKPDDLSNRGLTDVQEDASGKQESGEQNGPKKSYFEQEMTPTMNGDAAVSAKCVLTGVEKSNSATISAAQHTWKFASIINAPEGSLDLDVDTCPNGPASEGRCELQTPAASQYLASAKSTQDKTHAVVELRKTPPEPLFGKTSELRNFGEGTSSAPSPLPSSIATLEAVKHPPSVSAFEKPKEVEESSSLALAAEASAAKARFTMLPKPPISFSSAGGAGLLVQVPVSSKHDNNVSQEAAKAKEKPNGLHSGVFSSSMSGSAPSPSLFDNSNLKNGPVSMISSSLATSPLASAGFTNQALTNFASSAAPSANSSSSLTASWMSASSGSPPLSTLQPSLSSAAAFQFGFSGKTSAAVSMTLAASDAKARVMKNEVGKEPNSISGAVGTSFASGATGSGIFGLAASACSTGLSHSQNTGSESMFGMQSSGIGSGFASVSQSISFQSSSSTSSPIFGTSGVASFTSNAAPFSSSSSVTNLFASGPSFGFSSSTPSSELKSAVSAGVAASGTFGCATTVPAASSGGTGVPNLVGFSVGSLTTSSVTSMVSSSSSVTLGTSNFGASPSGDIASSSSGFSLQTPQTSSVTTFNLSPSTGFSFGGSSAPVFSFTSTSAATSALPPPSAPMFGNAASTITDSRNHEQMNTDDSMAEDTLQSANSRAPIFGQLPVPSPGGFTFGSTIQSSSPFQFSVQPSQNASTVQSSSPFQFSGQPSQNASTVQSSPFQFSGQPSQHALQNPPFQASGSLESNASGSFSLGSGGDKSGRKIVRVNRNKHRKK